MNLLEGTKQLKPLALAKNYYVIRIDGLNVIVDLQTKTQIENLLTAACELAYIKDLFGATHIFRPIAVRHIFESTANTRTLAALHQLQQQVEQAQIIKGISDGSV